MDISRMLDHWSSFLSSGREGQGMIEYTLVVAILAVTIIAVMVAIGPSIEEMFTNSTDAEARGEQQAALSSTIYE